MAKKTPSAQLALLEPEPAAAPPARGKAVPAPPPPAKTSRVAAPKRAAAKSAPAPSLLADDEAPPPPPRGRAGRSSGEDAPRENAQTMAARQREISVSEFFTKNRHLLGFDNPPRRCSPRSRRPWTTRSTPARRRASCPRSASRSRRSTETASASRSRTTGPASCAQQMPKVFGKLLYGSKFHRLRQSAASRASASRPPACTGSSTTGKPVMILSSAPGPRKPAHYFEIAIDTQKNQPGGPRGREIEWDEGPRHAGRDRAGGRLQQGAPLGGRATSSRRRSRTRTSRSPTRRRRIPSVRFERAGERAAGAAEGDQAAPARRRARHADAHDARTRRARNLALFLSKDFSRVSPKIGRGDLQAGPASTRDGVAVAACTAIGRGALQGASTPDKIMAPPTERACRRSART